MSSQLKEKQQQKDNKRDLDADKVFNEQLFNTLAYTGAGFGAGLVASVFLKHRKALTLLGAAGGGLYGAQNFMNELNSFNRFKNLANQSQQPNTLKREDQLATKNWDNFMPKQESLNQQKRYGGSGDDDDKSSSESKTRSNKPDEKKKSHEDASAKPKNVPKTATEPSKKTPTDKESSSKPSSSKESDKSSQKPSSPKTSSPSPKESSKSSQEQHQRGKEPEKKGNQGKEQQQQQQRPKEPEKRESQGKEQQQQRGKELESTSSRQSESKPESRAQGQHLQDFKSNKEAGKPAPGESRLYRGAERNLHSEKDREVDDLNDQQSRMVKQDKWGKSTKTGNKMKVEFPPENIAGGQFSGAGLTAKSQVNAVIE